MLIICDQHRTVLNTDHVVKIMLNGSTIIAIDTNGDSVCLFKAPTHMDKLPVHVKVSVSKKTVATITDHWAQGVDKIDVDYTAKRIYQEITNPPVSNVTLG